MATKKSSKKPAKNAPKAKTKAKTPAAKKTAPKPAAKKPTKATLGRSAAEVAAFLGIKLHKPLGADVTKHFRRGLPGYVEMLDDVAKALEREKTNLGIGEVTPAALLE